MLNKLEEFSSQFPESQVQLIMRLEESQKAFDDLKTKFETVEANLREENNELQTKIDNLEGICFFLIYFCNSLKWDLVHHEIYLILFIVI